MNESPIEGTRLHKLLMELMNEGRLTVLECAVIIVAIEDLRRLYDKTDPRLGTKGMEAFDGLLSKE